MIISAQLALYEYAIGLYYIVIEEFDALKLTYIM